MDSKLILKDFDAKIEVKAPSEENPNRDIAVIITVQEEDRDGDIIDVKGIKTDSYLKNPVVLWQHDHGTPIAKNISLSMVDGNMVAMARFPEEGTSEKADEIYGLIKAGIINAASIGFMPNFDEMDERKADNSPWGTGYQFKEVELLEYSFVSVPSNRSALIQQRSFLADNAKHKEEGAVSDKKSAAQPEPPPKKQENTKMPDLIELRGKRADLLEQVEKHFADYDPTEFPEAIALEIDEKQAEIANLDTAISRMETLERTKAAKAVPSAEKAFGSPSARIEVIGKSWLRNDDKPEPGIRFAQLARALAVGSKAMHSPIEWAKMAYGESHPVTLHLQKDVLNTGTDAEGGFTVPEDWGSDFIELLRNFTVVRRCNPQSPGMPNGNLTLPGLESGTTAGYVGEAAVISASDAAFREVKLAAKKIASITAMSNELLQYNAYGADTIVRDDLVESMAVAEDLQMLRGTASASAPTSFLEIATNAGNVINAPATSTLADFDKGLTDLELVLMNNNVSTVGAVWIMAPRTYQTLSNARDGNGNKAYPEMTNWSSDNTAMLRGKRVLISNQIPINLDTTTDESEIYLVQGRHVLLADTRRMQMMTTQHGSISYDAGTTMISTFSNDLTAFRLISEHDLNVRHVACVAVLNAVKW